jgi:hypothetical protein
MEFMEWLLKEDPNGLELGKGNYDYCDYRDADAVPFIVYRGGYIRAESHDTSLTHVHMYLSALNPASPLSDPVFKRGNPPVLPGPKRSDDNIAGKGREELMTHMVLGRLWTAAYCWSDEGDNRGSRRRVISFWNPHAQVASLKGEIFSMIRELDLEDEYTPGAKTATNDPREYLYEIQGNLMGHDEFMAGRKVEAPNDWDPSKLHTMEPGPAKDQIRRAYGNQPSPPKVDLQTRMMAYTGD